MLSRRDLLAAAIPLTLAPALNVLAIKGGSAKPAEPPKPADLPPLLKPADPYSFHEGQLCLKSGDAFELWQVTKAEAYLRVFTVLTSRDGQRVGHSETADVDDVRVWRLFTPLVVPSKQVFEAAPKNQASAMDPGSAEYSRWKDDLDAKNEDFFRRNPKLRDSVYYDPHFMPN